MITSLLVIAILAGLANGLSPEAEILKNDFVFKLTKKSNRLAGIIIRPNAGKCDLVRPKIKTFGYCYQDENEAKKIDTSKERRWVREAVQQWENCGGIRIIEEPKCRVGADFITIKVGNYHPVVFPGVESDCNIVDFNMYTTFFTDNIKDYEGRERVRESMIKMYFLHEFGHFLGFDHEHNRKDRKDECDTEVDQTHVGPEASYGNYFLSKEYDLDSIMNYCRPQVHYKPWLSELDKKTVRQVYGGGNQKECDAVTKPWKWGPGEGLDDWTLEQLGVKVPKTTPTPTTPTPFVCADAAPKKQCQDLIQSCKDEAMKHWCPKTCNYCQ